MIRSLLCIIGFAIVVRAETVHFGLCPKITPQIKFNPQKFSGSWYIQASYRKDINCIATYLSHLGQGKYEGFREVKSITSIDLTHYLINAVPEEPNGGEFVISTPNIFFPSRMMLADTDYINFAVVFYCRDFGLFHIRNAEIWNRKRFPDAIANPSYISYLFDSIDWNSKILLKINHKICKGSAFDS